MNLFGFLKTPEPDNAAKEFFLLATDFEISRKESDLLLKYEAEKETYKKERLMMQTSFTQGFISHYARKSRNGFFIDTGKILEEKIKEFYSECNFFNFENEYELNEHLRRYYSFNTPDHMLNAMFRAMWQESALIKDHEVQIIFKGSMNEFIHRLRTTFVSWVENLKRRGLA